MLRQICHLLFQLVPVFIKLKQICHTFCKNFLNLFQLNSNMNMNFNQYYHTPPLQHGKQQTTTTQGLQTSSSLVSHLNASTAATSSLIPPWQQAMYRTMPTHQHHQQHQHQQLVIQYSSPPQMSASFTPSPKEQSSPKEDDVIYLHIPKSKMNRKEVKSLLGEDTSLEREEAFIPPPSCQQEVNVKTKGTTVIDDKTVGDENLSAAASGEGGPVSPAMPMLDPSVVPEGEGMVDR